MTTERQLHIANLNRVLNSEFAAYLTVNGHTVKMFRTTKSKTQGVRHLAFRVDGTLCDYDTAVDFLSA
jgi:hypothetical protein